MYCRHKLKSVPFNRTISDSFHLQPAMEFEKLKNVSHISRNYIQNGNLD